MASAPVPPPKLSSSNSSSSLSDHFPNLRQFFQRSASQPSQVQTQHVTASSAAASASTMSSSSSGSTDDDARQQALGSCTQVLATSITALFRAINAFGGYSNDESADSSTTRRAKLLYVQLLDKAQRERGEWRGFASSSSSSSSPSDEVAQNRPKSGASESASGIIAANVSGLSRDETFALLNELVDVSFRSMRGPLVSAEIYAKHKKPLAALSLGIPVSLHALLAIRAILSELGRDEKLCVFRLLALWHAMAVASEAQDLRRTIQEKHHLVFSDCTELEFLTSRRDPRHDTVATALLLLLVLYHDVLFSDVEFLLIKQELQLSELLRRPRVGTDTREAESPSATESKADTPVAAVSAESGVCALEHQPRMSTSERADLPQDGTSDASKESAKPESVGASQQDSPPSTSLNAVGAGGLVAPLPEARRSREEAEAVASASASAVDADSAVQAPAESSSQQKSRESSGAISESNAGTTRSRARTELPSNAGHHHAYSHARAHGPVVSIRHHSLSPRKLKQSKRFSFESLSVSTTTVATATASSGQHSNHSNAKSDDARHATPLWNDVVHIADYFGASLGEPVAAVVNGDDNSKSAVLQPREYSDSPPAAMMHVEQHTPEAKPTFRTSEPCAKIESTGATPAALAAPARQSPQAAEQEEGNAGSSSRKKAASPTRRASSLSSPSSAKSLPAPPHEITDLANTYFSFSFAAATLRTMAIMAVYAIRRHQHQHQ